MSDKYIPTTEDVRRAYQEHCRDYDAVDGLATSPESYEEEFDQWLALDKAAIERVKALHRKGTVYSHEDSCTNSSEEHREEHHRESASRYGEYYCEQMPEYDICTECSEHADPDQEYPCPTIRALETGAEND